MADDSDELTRKLDDPRWRPLAEVFEKLRRQTGNATLTARDLTDDLWQGRRRAMRRWLNRPDRELVLKDFWDRHEVNARSDGPQIVERNLRGGTRQIIPLFDSVFYLWDPDSTAPQQAPVKPGSKPALNLPPPPPSPPSAALKEAKNREEAAAVVMCELWPPNGDFKPFKLREQARKDVNKRLQECNRPAVSMRMFDRAQKQLRTRRSPSKP